MDTVEGVESMARCASEVRPRFQLLRGVHARQQFARTDGGDRVVERASRTMQRGRVDTGIIDEPPRMRRCRAGEIADRRQLSQKCAQLVDVIARRNQRMRHIQGRDVRGRRQHLRPSRVKRQTCPIRFVYTLRIPR